jgi:uncharacterized membrane protein YcfT
MNDFWNNISRYPRFFISSLAGLILVILAPFKNLFKIKKFRFILPFFLIGVYFSYIIYDRFIKLLKYDEFIKFNKFIFI